MSEVKCPHCQHEIGDLHEIVSEDGAEVERECDGCGKTIRIGLDITYYYSCKPLPKDCKHEDETIICLICDERLSK